MAEVVEIARGADTLVKTRAYTNAPPTESSRFVPFQLSSTHTETYEYEEVVTKQGTELLPKPVTQEFEVSYIEQKGTSEVTKMLQNQKRARELVEFHVGDFDLVEKVGDMVEYTYIVGYIETIAVTAEAESQREVTVTVKVKAVSYGEEAATANDLVNRDNQIAYRNANVESAGG